MEILEIHFSSVDSTQTWTLTHCQELDPHKLTCITAETQTAGRGRYGRKWSSQKGNLYLSLFFTLEENDPRLPHLSQLIAYAAAQFLLKENIEVKIKWPNDLLVNEKKISGALVETVPLKKRVGIVIGLGMNVNASVETDQPTTSLRELTGKEWNLKEVKKGIISNFLTALTIPFSTLVPYFNSLLAYKGEKVSCKVGEKKVEGTLIGITEKGGLELATPKGLTTLATGELSHLRPT